MNIKSKSKSQISVLIAALLATSAFGQMTITTAIGNGADTP